MDAAAAPSGWWVVDGVWCVDSKIACPKSGKLNVVLRLAAAKRRAKSTKAAYRLDWARVPFMRRGGWGTGSVSGSASPCGFRFWNRTTCAALSIRKANWNAGDIIGKHKLYKPNAVLVFPFSLFPFFFLQFSMLPDCLMTSPGCV